MTIEVLTFIVGLAGVVIMLLLSLIAYFLKRLLTKFDNMNVILEGVVKDAAVQNTSCRLIHEGVTARLNAHSKEIEQLKKQ